MTPKVEKQLAVLLVDPSLFTAPYDAALTEGLLANGVSVRWAVRPPRDGEEVPIAEELRMPLFYRGLKGSVKNAGLLQKARKGVSHLLGCLRILRKVRNGEFSLVHVQWAVFPIVDAWLFRRISAVAPVVLTLHDISPFNGNPSSRLQLIGFDKILEAASYVVVHTSAARDKLIERGLDGARIRHIPHGVLALRAPNPAENARSSASIPGKRPWTFVLFGKIQAYKGIDILVEAVARIPAHRRDEVKVIVAGEALISLDPFLAQIERLDLKNQIEFRARYHSEEEMSGLFAEADAFIFPYKAIEASGVLFLVHGLHKWIVASDLGAFRDMVVDRKTGRLVPPENPAALADAIVASIDKVPDPSHVTAGPGWHEIGLQTRRLYEEALAKRAAVP